MCNEKFYENNKIYYVYILGNQKSCDLKLINVNRKNHNGLWTCKVDTTKFPILQITSYIVNVIEKPVFLVSYSKSGSNKVNYY